MRLVRNGAFLPVHMALQQTLDQRYDEFVENDVRDWGENVQFAMCQKDSHLVPSEDLPPDLRCYLSDEVVMDEVFEDFCNKRIDGQATHGLVVILSPNDDQVPEARDSIDGLLVVFLSTACVRALALWLRHGAAPFGFSGEETMDVVLRRLCELVKGWVGAAQEDFADPQVDEVQANEGQIPRQEDESVIQGLQDQLTTMRGDVAAGASGIQARDKSLSNANAMLETSDKSLGEANDKLRRAKNDLSEANERVQKCVLYSDDVKSLHAENAADYQRIHRIAEEYRRERDQLRDGTCGDEVKHLREEVQKLKDAVVCSRSSHTTNADLTRSIVLQ